jgi:lipopolysaccharide cholinephosphotransferase
MADIRLTLPSAFYEPEERALLVSAETKRLWAVELDLLAELQRVCRKHGIQYFAISGTLIGAARHHGFIPWDDDIDVVMMRSEYKRLEQVAAGEFKEPYFFQTNQTDPGSLRGHAQLRNSSTTAILESEMMNGTPLCHFNQGVFLDIFPLDKLPNDANARTMFIAKLSKLKARFTTFKNRQRFATNARLFPKRRHWLKTMFLWHLQHVAERMTGKDFLAEAYRDFDEFAQSHNDDANACECTPLTFSTALRRHEVFQVTDFASTIELPFENLTISCPSNYDEVLTRAFGDWHKHVVAANSHGKMKLDLDHSFRNYLS